jgi:hypothetical protein
MTSSLGEQPGLYALEKADSDYPDSMTSAIFLLHDDHRCHLWLES